MTHFTYNFIDEYREKGIQKKKKGKREKEKRRQFNDNPGGSKQ